jgi:hypothetical protein
LIARGWPFGSNPCRLAGACRSLRRSEDGYMKRVVITTGIVAAAGGIASVLLMPSCDPDCEVEAKPSVIVQLLSKQPTAEGESVAAEEVWYEWTGEDGEKISSQAECLDDECTEWILGDGRPGIYAFHATVCGKQYDSSVTIGLNDEGCEVDTQMVELPVDACADMQAPESPRPPQALAIDDGLDVRHGGVPKTCTLEARVSVLVSVVAQVESHLMPVPTDRVFYEVGNSGEEPGVCINENCSQFAAGFEKTGDFMVGAEVCGETITARATVGKTSDGCHVETQHLQLVADVSKCKPPMVYQEPSTPPPPQTKPQCGVEMRASAFVLPVTDGGDVWIPYPTEKLVYVHDGVQQEAYCAQETDNGKCTWWVTGFGQTGRFQAFTETCGIESAVTFSVEPREDGCYPDTEFVPVFMDTHGCIRSSWPPKGNPPPSTPSGADRITE